ncbi:uncharacterized protein BP5553_01136 [Venustampulla echinocandica]|uniref:Ubiquitin-like protease family profile domain-containing protein n=1 Tax=Venustampulla echinocandica TaxID=2656787 RepID=A0A370U070_9HELO|nr:uncharacterized protein BP5553_01136 [Venustampulla echinocandica]RDL41157.1 hypothetical protein BP5553_01136 [Venustampulla echinocandica]
MTMSTQQGLELLAEKAGEAFAPRLMLDDGGNNLLDQAQTLFRKALYQNPQLLALVKSLYQSPLTFLPPPSDPWSAKAAEILENPESARILDVNHSSIKGLRPRQMISDEVIEAYSKLLRKSGVRIGTTRLLDPRVERHHPMDRDIGFEELCTCREIFIPVFWNSHWTFARLVSLPHERSMVVEFYDSYPWANPQIPSVLLIWLEKRFGGVRMQVGFGASPHQATDSYDCGLFTLMGIRLMASGLRHLFQVEADEIMPTLRPRILAELLAGSLDPTSTDCQRFTQQQAVILKKETLLFFPGPNKFLGSGTTHADPLDLCSPEASIGDDIYLEANLHTAKLETTESTSSAAEECTTHCSVIVSSDRVISPMSPEHGPGSTSQTTDHASPEPTLSTSRSSNMGPLGATKPNRQQIAELLVASFADKTNIINCLRGAVATYRLMAGSSGEDPASLWHQLGIDRTGSPDVIRHRYTRFRFSQVLHQKLYGRKHHLEGCTCLVSRRTSCAVKSNAMSMLSVPRNEWRRAKATAKSSQIWSSLVECASPFLGEHASTVLCAIGHSTSTVESVSKGFEQYLCDGIACRLRDSKDHALGTLIAASGLFKALTGGWLPLHRLKIEGTLESLGSDFSIIMSMDRLPDKILLPTRK